MCDCFEKTLGRVKAHILKNQKVVNDSVSVKYEHSMFGLPDMQRVVVMPIKATFRRVKVSGEIYKNKSNETINIAPSYCQFCGEKLESEDE